MVAEWFYAEQGQQRGPVTFDELQARAQAGLLQPTDLVWKEGLRDWRPASSQPGLFGEPAPRIAAAPRPEYDDRRELERPRSPAGKGAGWKIALFAAGGVLISGVLCCGVIGAIYFANQGPNNEHTWRLDTGQSKVWPLHFQQGDKVVITVTSVSDTDVDLYVFDDKSNLDKFLKTPNIDIVAKTLCLRYDDRLDSDCRVEFLAAKTQDYWALVVNRRSQGNGRNATNSGKLVFEPAPK